MAARRSAVCAGNLTVGGASSKWVSAIEVRRAKLLLPMPKPSTTELLRRWSEWRLLLLLAAIVGKWNRWRTTGRKRQKYVLSVDMSCPNSAPMTPKRTTAVVCFRFNSAKLDGLRTISSSSSSKSSGCPERNEETRNDFIYLSRLRPSQCHKNTYIWFGWLRCLRARYALLWVACGQLLHNRFGVRVQWQKLRPTFHQLLAPFLTHATQFA